MGRAVWLPWYIKMGRRQRSKSGPLAYQRKTETGLGTGRASPRVSYAFPDLDADLDADSDADLDADLATSRTRL